MANIKRIDTKIDKEDQIKEMFEDVYWACWRFFHKLIDPIRYRIFGHKHHVIKTELSPNAWYDADIRILYGVMECVRFFVEEDMNIIAPEEYKEEVERIKKEESEEYKQHHLESWQNQYERDKEIIDIYVWWKSYPSREKEIDDSLTAWADYCKKFSSEGRYDDIFFINNTRYMNEDEIKEEKRLHAYHSELEAKLQDEEQEMLKKAIDLRGYMWE